MQTSPRGRTARTEGDIEGQEARARHVGLRSELHGIASRGLMPRLCPTCGRPFSGDPRIGGWIVAGALTIVAGALIASRPRDDRAPLPRAPAATVTPVAPASPPAAAPLPSPTPP